MLQIAKTFEFCSSHTLYRNEWSAEKNREVFGKCSNPNGHGHNFQLEVVLSGTVDPMTGMILDASKLKAFVKELVLNDIDHKDLNKDVIWFKQIPTVENLVNAIWERLAPAVPNHAPSAKLHMIRIWETSSIYAARVEN